MSLANYSIGANFRPKIIAEIGINHQGSLDTAKKMSELAIENGADFVKTQMHIPDKEMSQAAKQLVPSHCSESIYEIMEDCSLSLDDEYELKEFIEQSDCQYLCTPFSAEAAHILGRDFKVNMFKIGSGECNNDYVLKAASSYSKPLIISTGMNTLSSCKRTYNLVTNDYGVESILLHTTNLYPTPPHLVRLGGISELQEIAGHDSVGLSDHTINNLACLGAVALGAVILERHFTDTKDREGPDIINSMTPFELRDLRDLSNEMFLLRGGSKELELKEEQDTRDFAFATYVASKDIQLGERFSRNNVCPKRPGCGDYLAQNFSMLDGKLASSFIPEGEHIVNAHVEP